MRYHSQVGILYVAADGDEELHLMTAAEFALDAHRVHMTLCGLGDPDSGWNLIDDPDGWKLCPDCREWAERNTVGVDDRVDHPDRNPSRKIRMLLLPMSEDGTLHLDDGTEVSLAQMVLDGWIVEDSTMTMDSSPHARVVRLTFNMNNKTIAWNRGFKAGWYMRDVTSDYTSGIADKEYLAGWKAGRRQRELDEYAEASEYGFITDDHQVDDIWTGNYVDVKVESCNDPLMALLATIGPKNLGRLYASLDGDTFTGPEKNDLMIELQHKIGAYAYTFLAPSAYTQFKLVVDALRGNLHPIAGPVCISASGRVQAEPTTITTNSPEQMGRRARRAGKDPQHDNPYVFSEDRRWFAYGWYLEGEEIPF
jgi:hypothetical protein